MRWKNVSIWIGVVGLIIWGLLWLYDATKMCNHDCYYGASYLFYAIPFVLLVLIPVVINIKNITLRSDNNGR